MCLFGHVFRMQEKVQVKVLSVCRSTLLDLGEHIGGRDRIDRSTSGTAGD